MELRFIRLLLVPTLYVQAWTNGNWPASACKGRKPMPYFRLPVFLAIIDGFNLSLRWLLDIHAQFSNLVFVQYYAETRGVGYPHLISFELDRVGNDVLA